MTKKRQTEGTARSRQPKKPKELSPLDQLKLQIAAELGLSEKLAAGGWGDLTAAETGRVGGILNRRLKELHCAIGPKGILVPVQKA